MTKAIETVKTGEITVATRSVEIDGVKVESGQVIALLGPDDGERACCPARRTMFPQCAFRNCA